MQTRTEKLNRLWDLHYTLEKGHEAARPARFELEDMRMALFRAQSMEEAEHIRKERSRKKREYMAYVQNHLVPVNKELSKVARSIPGNHVMYAKTGKIDMVPEPLRGFKGWANRLKLRLRK